MIESELVLEYLSRYSGVFLFIVIAGLFGVATLLISYVLQPKFPDDARMPFPVRYYIFAMLFVIFDIEIIFLYPWAVAFKSIGIIGLVEMMIFIGLFVLAYVYAWRKGALEWD